MTGSRSSQFVVGPKRLRKTGWEYVHIAVDDYTRLAYAEVLSDEKATSVVAFLKRRSLSMRATASPSSGC